MEGKYVFLFCFVSSRFEIIKTQKQAIVAEQFYESWKIHRCGEDERPLNELLILQLGSEHPNGRYNISMCKVLSNQWSQERRKFLRSETVS